MAKQVAKIRGGGGQGLNLHSIGVFGLEIFGRGFRPPVDTTRLMMMMNQFYQTLASLSVRVSAT